MIIANLYTFTKILSEYATEKLFLEFTKEDREKAEILLQDLEVLNGKSEFLNQDVAERLKLFWNINGVQKAYNKRNAFHCPDSAKYPEFEPTNQDILHIRMPTVGVTKVEVAFKNIKLTVCDCGGQRSERRKWHHLFDDTSAILFVAAISEFDQKLAEDDQMNRMEEAMNLFWRVFGGKYFNKSSIILFLNKIDIFREKIKTVQIRDHFVKFEGDNTYETGVRFFRRQFRDGLSPSFRKRMYTHETCAISDQVQLIINTVIDTVVQENLKDTGMI
uniref:Uncharacterized protein n=1 Tax=Caenorhabditis japonica TaxID=281687 RepID=A0A8R1DSZ4_CAEJA